MKARGLHIQLKAFEQELLKHLGERLCEYAWQGIDIRIGWGPSKFVRHYDTKYSWCSPVEEYADLSSCPQVLNLLYVRFEGTVTAEEILAGRKDASDNSDFHFNLRQLVDLRNGSMEQVSSASLSAIGASTIFNKAVKRAFVVARDVDYGLLRMYGVFAEHHQQQIRIFRSLEEACEWLDIPISTLPAE